MDDVPACSIVFIHLFSCNSSNVWSLARPYPLVNFLSAASWRALRRRHRPSTPRPEAEAATSLIGCGAKDEGEPSGPQDPCPTVAVLQQAHSGTSSSESTRTVGVMSVLQPSASVHSQEGVTSQCHAHRVSEHCQADAERAACPPGGGPSHSDHLPPRHEQGDGRHRAPTRCARAADGSSASDNTLPGKYKPGRDDVGDHGILGCGPGGRRADSGLREREPRSALKNTASSRSSGGTTSTPLFIGKKVMAMAALMTATATSMLAGLHLGEDDGLWEIACAPHSWLSQAAEEHGLRPRRINLSTGYDLYDSRTWERLRELRRLRRPKKLWISLPCTKWSQ